MSHVVALAEANGVNLALMDQGPNRSGGDRAMQGGREFLDGEKCLVATHDVSARRIVSGTQTPEWRSTVARALSPLLCEIEIMVQTAPC